MTPAAAETESPEESRPTAGPVKDRDAAEQLEIAALRKELAEQEALLDEHSSALSANESALETMIKDMRRELAACRDDSWRLDEASELGDMKERLFMSMLPRASASAACGAEPGPEPGAASMASGFAALSVLNDEMDQELESLMEQLGSVKHQFSSLDAQRRSLQEELEQERQALADLRADGDGYDGWTSDPEEEEMFRREAEEQEARQSQAEVRQDTSSKSDAQSLSGVPLEHTADAGVGERG